MRITELGSLPWLALVGALACVVLIVVVLMQASRHVKHRRAVTAPRASTGLAPEPPGLGLDGTSLAPLDRVFPRQPGQFLMLVATISLGTWLAGYLLAPDIQRFLGSPEWLFQPIYIAAHLIALRLFINVFTRNYAAGIAQLDVSPKQALRGIRTILGPYGVVAAAVIAAPFSYFDFHYLFSPRYARMGRDEVVRAIDYVMWGIWSLEWLVNALIWVLLIGFMIKNCLIISRFPFRKSIHVVLQDKHYRPFLQMSAQGATIALGFSLVTVVYLAYTGGEVTDYTGLGITVSLLLFCFVPPWVVLRRKVDQAVMVEMASLRQGARLSHEPAPLGLTSLDATSNAASRPLEARLDEAVALLRLWHLQSLYGHLGRTEAKAIVVRLLAPAATIGWQVVQNYTTLVQSMVKMVGVTLGK